MIEEQYLEQLETALRAYYLKYPQPLHGEAEWKRMYDFVAGFQIGDERFFNPIGYMMYRKKVMDDVLEFRKQIEAAIKKVKGMNSVGFFV